MHHLLPELDFVGLLFVSAGCECAGVPSKQHEVVPVLGGVGRKCMQFVGCVSIVQPSRKALAVYPVVRLWGYSCNTASSSIW